MKIAVCLLLVVSLISCKEEITSPTQTIIGGKVEFFGTTPSAKVWVDGVKETVCPPLISCDETTIIDTHETEIEVDGSFYLVIDSSLDVDYYEVSVSIMDSRSISCIYQPIIVNSGDKATAIRLQVPCQIN